MSVVIALCYFFGIDPNFQEVCIDLSSSLFLDNLIAAYFLHFWLCLRLNGWNWLNLAF